MKHRKKQEEILKGCGKRFISPLPEDKQDKCGDILDEKVELCSECKQKAKAHKLDLKEFYKIAIQTKNFDRAKEFMLLIKKYEEIEC